MAEQSKPIFRRLFELVFPQMPDLLKTGTIDGAVAVEPIRSQQ